MSDDIVLIEKSGHIATVTMNRAPAFNALNGALRDGLRKAISKLELDDEVRVVVLRGDGRGFCAGADLMEAPTIPQPTHQMIEEEYRPILTGIGASSKIWIAQVHGAAAGIGAAIAMNCDMVSMADDASIYMAFAAIALVPDGGNCWLLHRSMGYRKALQAILEGRKIPASEAESYGLVNEIHPAADLDVRTQEMAARIAAGAPLAAAAAKRLLRSMDSLSYADSIMAEGVEQSALTRSADFAEGVAAFRDKRKPEFKGK